MKDYTECVKGLRKSATWYRKQGADAACERLLGAAFTIEELLHQHQHDKAEIEELLTMHYCDQAEIVRLRRMMEATE